MLKPSDKLADSDGPSLGELLTRLVDDGKAYARAEVDLARAKAEETVLGYRTAALLAGGALAFGFVALILLFVAIGAGLSSLIGPFGGYAVSALLAAVISGGLALGAKARSRLHD